MPTTDSRTELARVWQQLDERDFAISSDVALGLGAELRQHIVQTFFTEKLLESDHPAVHHDRDRARDVIRYAWSGGELSLHEHESVAISNRSGYAGSRTPKRAILLDDAPMIDWLQTVLRLVPPPARQPEGTFGVNFLRTRTQVVSGPHHDEEEYVLVYVVDKVGDGAETTLHAVDDPTRIVHRVTLAPGDLIVFRDAAVLHNASPLISPPGVAAHRDAVVCTVNYPDTYRLA